MTAKLPDPDPTCPHCNGPMPSPISIYTIRPDGVPVSKYVCRHCHRVELQRQREKYIHREEMQSG